MTESERQITELDVLAVPVVTILRQGPPGGYRQLVVSSPAPASESASLSTLRPERLLDVPMRDLDDAKAMLAGLWLWFDRLEESHRIAQDIPSPTGNFWHAILHRREGDFSNAKYWYGRCRGHRVNHILGAVTASLVGGAGHSSVLKHLSAGEWDGSAFVDLVEMVHQNPSDPRFAVAVRLQQAEWHALFHHCALAASGSPLD